MLLHYVYIYCRTYTHSFACFLPKLSENKVHIEEKKDILLLGHSGHMYAVTQLCPTLCSPMDRSLPGSSIHGLHQARIRTLVWVAMPSSRGCPAPGFAPMTPVAPASQVGSLLLSHRGSPPDHNTVAKFGNFNIVMIFLSNETLPLNLRSSLSTVQIP